MQPSSPSVHPRRRKSATTGLRFAAAAAFGAATLLATAAPTFVPDDQPTGWVTRPTLSSTDLRSGSEVIFRADYKGGLWTGTVHANYIDATGTAQGSSPWPSYETAATLASMNWDTGRKIVTRHANGSNIALRWSSLATTQQALLGTSTTGPQILNFVRGDRSNEDPNGTKLRKRESVQGDIQHSTLVYWKHSGGAKRLYVGGNDGMLHAFDATTGSEVFAYVPSMLMSRLPKLAANPYVHSLFVDGGLTVAEVTLSASTRTLLAGALGGGGKGLFALDLTDPSPASEAAAASAIKWEITPASTGFANLGYSYAAPRFARLNNGTAVVIVGNGYLNAGNGRATLLVINADTGALVREIDTGSGSTSSPNGLSTATVVDTNYDGKADYAYAGDIDGNLWRFNLSATDPAAFTATLLLATSPAKAITSPPVVVNHPYGGRIVLFGTGRMLATTDSADTAAHYVYGLWDGAPVANTTWLDQTVGEVNSGGRRLRTVSANVPNWGSGGHRGWRLTLPAGERAVGEAPFVSDDRYYFVSTNPTVAAAGDGQAAGSNWLNEVNFLTGGRPTGAIFDINGDGKIDSADNIGGEVIIGKHLDSGVASQAVLVDLHTLSATMFNRQSDLDYSLPTVDAGPGVSGGHFDVDFYYTSGTSFSDVKHRHEYDDTFDVTGVNFLNASDPTFNLGSKLGSAVAFKVLVMNQYLNPAAKLSVGGGAGVSVKTYGGQASETSADALLTNAPTYTLANINTLMFNLPLDAFKSKDWWGDGGTARAGLIPTQTGCVKQVSSNGATDTLGLNGERHDGALTIQLIKASTPASALELNYPAGGPKYGWRVKAANFISYVVAEYTTFWHHPNGKCYGQSGWVPNPPEDPDSGGKGSNPAAGSMDPKDGTFGVTPAGVTVTGVTTTVVGNTTTITVTYSDGKTQQIVIQSNGDGSETVTTTGRDGSVDTETRMSAGSLGRAPEEILQGSRRINWREVTRQ